MDQEKEFRKKVKNSFLNARNHMNTLENEIFALKEIILLQNTLIKEIAEKIINLKKEKETPEEEISNFFDKKNENNILHSLSTHQAHLKHILSTSNIPMEKLDDKSDNNEDFNSSIGNNRVKHILSTSNIPMEKLDDKSDNNEDFNSSIGNNRVKHLNTSPISSLSSSKKQTKIISDNTKINEKPLEKWNFEENKQKELSLQRKRVFDENFNIFKQKVNETFAKLSKQELLIFLTIYQFTDEKKAITYFDLANKLSLSENCIRSYTSSLIRKGLPVIKQRANNKLIFLTVDQDFRSLNLRQKLIDLYYGIDPFQVKLFEIPLS